MSGQNRATADALLRLARERRALLRQLRDACLKNDTRAVVALARKLTGLDDEAGDRTSKSLN